MTTNIGSIVVPVKRASRHLTMRVIVTGTRTFRLRCQIGLVLIRFAAWFMPFKTEVKIDD